MKYFSTFSGIGGFEIGIESVIDAECVGYSEIDPYAIKVYENHFKGVKNYGDITKIKTEELPDFDLLVGGFPCQAFSIAGKRKGFEETRGTLFFELARILRDKRVDHFIFENVKGLVSHDGGNTFRTIIATLDELGFDCEWQVVDSKHFGVPQHRERIIIVGHHRTVGGRKIFPIAANSGKILEPLNNPKHSMYRIYSPSGISPTLTTSQGGYRQPKILQRPRGFNKGGSHDIAPTVSANSWHQNNVLLTEEDRIRRLTPREYERLQAFPDDWTRFDSEGNQISDAQRYKMGGNAVTTRVIAEVVRRSFA